MSRGDYSRYHPTWNLGPRDAEVDVVVVTTVAIVNDCLRVFLHSRDQSSPAPVLRLGERRSGSPKALVQRRPKCGLLIKSTKGLYRATGSVVSRDGGLSRGVSMMECRGLRSDYMSRNNDDVQFKNAGMSLGF